MELEQQGQVDSRAEVRNDVKHDSGEKQPMIAYSLCLSKADVVVLSVHQVILVENRMFRWHGVSSVRHLHDQLTQRLTSCGQDDRQDQEVHRYDQLTSSNEPNRSRGF